MFRLEKEDWKFFAEYDTMDEYRELKKDAEEDYKQFVLAQAKKEKIDFAINNTKRKANDDEYKINFVELQLLFLDDVKQYRNVSNSTIKAYNNAFNKLIDFFDTNPINNITLREYKNFRKQLQNTLTRKKTPITNSAINDIMTYVNMFLNFAKDDGQIDNNPLGSLKKLDEVDASKSNFTSKQILEIINYPFEKEFYNFCFRMMAYHGMRYDDLYNIEQEWIKDDIIDFDYGKTIITPPPNNLNNQLASIAAYWTLGCIKKLATF